MHSDQPSPSRNSPAAIRYDAPIGDVPAEQQRHEQHDGAGHQHRRPAEPVGGPADHRGEREHPEHVHADHHPDHLERRRRRGACAAASSPSPRPSPRAPAASAARRRRRPGRVRTTSHHPRPRRPGAGRPPARERRLPGDQQRVGTQPDADDGAGDQHPGSAEQERSGQRAGRPSARPAVRRSPVRFGPATAPIVVAHTTIESARARLRGPGEVGGGVAGLVVRRGRRPEQRRTDQQQRRTTRRPRPRTQSTAPAAPSR